MVNPAQILAAAGAANLHKRQETAWTSEVTTSYDWWTEPGSVEIQGYYTTTEVPLFGIPAVSTVRETTLTSVLQEVTPLLSPTPLDPGCRDAISAYERNLTFITQRNEYYAVFEVGFNPTCLPDGYFTIRYYSPGICPGGYTIAHTPRPVSTAGAETAVHCCYSSYNWDNEFGCVSYLNPIRMTTDSGAPGLATATDPVSDWTVVAEYTTVATSTSIYVADAVSGGTVTSLPTTSRTAVQTTTGHTIISGNDAAYVIAPYISIHWASTDTAVLEWLSRELNVTGNTSDPPEPPTEPPSGGLSGGAIAGIVIGAILGLALVIGALLLCLRRRKRQGAVAPPYQGDNFEEPKELVHGSPDAVYVESVVPKSELDSTTLTPEQYAAHSAVPSPNTHEYTPYSQPVISPTPVGAHSNTGYKAYSSPQYEVPGSERQPSSPPRSSVGGSTLQPTDRAQSPSEWTDQAQRPDTDMSGFLINNTDPVTNLRTSTTQLERLKAEKARLQRLQEISEQEARLEEQLERELARERR